MNTPPAKNREDELARFGERENDDPVEGQDEPFQDLLAASQSSLDFWDNLLDDEDWNSI